MNTRLNPFLTRKYAFLVQAAALDLALYSRSKTQSRSGESGSTKSATTKPNILLIYFDDLGYGAVSAYGQTTLPPPNIDNLANGGVRFTNGYATSATCTPSRYGLLTGVYPWRNDDARILPGNAPMLIDTAMVTLPKMLRKVGYRTAVVGKWHLGLGDGNVDWNQDIQQNTNDVGFDYSYIMAATTDRTPTVYIDNRKVVGLTKADSPSPDLKSPCYLPAFSTALADRDYPHAKNALQTLVDATARRAVPNPYQG